MCDVRRGDRVPVRSMKQDWGVRQGEQNTRGGQGVCDGTLHSVSASSA